MNHINLYQNRLGLSEDAVCYRMDVLFNELHQYGIAKDVRFRYEVMPDKGELVLVWVIIPNVVLPPYPVLSYDLVCQFDSWGVWHRHEFNFPSYSQIIKQRRKFFFKTDCEPLNYLMSLVAHYGYLGDTQVDREVNNSIRWCNKGNGDRRYAELLGFNSINENQ